MNRSEFHQLFASTKPVIGMVHLEPLPGSPLFSGNRDEIFEAAMADVKALEQGGVSAILVENFGDAPFFPDRVPAETVACITAILQYLKSKSNLPFGVNVLRNDGYAAVAIAAATGVQFVRVNVLSGAAVTDQGIISSNAHNIARLRRNLGVDVKIFADVQVKHATPQGAIPIEQAATELFERALADALICTGAATGSTINLEELAALRKQFPNRPLIAGSGVTAENAKAIFELADAAIVGTYFKVDGKVSNPVDPERVRSMIQQINN